MSTTDRRQPQQPDYPFLQHSCVTLAMKKHYLAWRLFDQGEGVWAAVETVAQKLGVDRRTVMRNLRKLQGIGLIEVTEQFRHGRQKANFVTFPSPDWWIEGGGQMPP